MQLQNVAASCVLADVLRRLGGVRVHLGLIRRGRVLSRQMLPWP